jgi:hypothetical protein
VGARRLLGDAEIRGGRETPGAANDFRKNAFRQCKPERCGKAPDLGVDADVGIDDEDGDGRAIDIENRPRAARAEGLR